MQKESYKLSKKDRRQIRKQGVSVDLTTLRNIKPKTINQSDVFETYYDGCHMFVYGSAGTGKSFMGMYLALKSVLSGEYDSLKIIRSCVPAREMGFLPGNACEKMSQYEAPYSEICNKLFDYPGDSYKILKNEGVVEFISTSYMRGRTYDNCVLIVDECQNMNWQELYTIMTRVGQNTRLILCGDMRQSDLMKDKNDIAKMMQVCQRLDNMDFVELGHRDIMRSQFTKDVIITCEQLGYN